MKKKLTLLYLIVFSFILVSCGKKPAHYGIYEGIIVLHGETVGPILNGKNILHREIRLVINKKDTLIWSIRAVDDDGDYSVSEMPYEIINNKLVIQATNETITLDIIYEEDGIILSSFRTKRSLGSLDSVITTKIQKRLVKVA